MEKFWSPEDLDSLDHVFEDNNASNNAQTLGELFAGFINYFASEFK